VAVSLIALLDLLIYAQQINEYSARVQAAGFVKNYAMLFSTASFPKKRYDWILFWIILNKRSYCIPKAALPAETVWFVNQLPGIFYR
jgi:hypothetical protein